MARHLTPGERDLVAEWLAAGVSQADIARALGRDPSTIFRELKRNSCGCYHATDAQRRCDTRQREARRKRRNLESEEQVRMDPSSDRRGSPSNGQLQEFSRYGGCDPKGDDRCGR